jgi:signal peptidase II
VSRKYRLALTITACVLVLDQITKVIIDRGMALYQSLEIIPNFVHITYVRNTGAAFGFLAGSHSNLRIVFFIAISTVAIICIFYLLKNISSELTAFIVSLSLILGGALGNFVDRLRLGEVIDFIDIHWYQVHWPAFNVADSAITIGVVLLFLQMVRKRSLSF